MVSFFETILVFAGIGQLLDLILIGPKEREKLGNFIDRAEPAGSFLSRYLKMLSLSRDIIFGRYFSESFASLNFFRSTVILSVLSFVLVVFMQTALFGTLPASLSSPHQVLAILAFLIFNVLIDYFSISQTKAFIDAASAANSWFRSLIFLISDVLVTMNIFILAFSAFLMLFAYTYLAPSALSEKTLILYLDPTTLDEGESNETSPLPDDFQAGILLGKSGETTRTNFLAYNGNFTLTPEVFEQIVKLTLGQSLTEISIRPTDKDSALRSLEISVLDDPVLKEILDSAFEAREPEAFQISIVSSFFPQSLTELNHAYTSVFSFVDLLEDEFPQNIMSDVGWTPLSDVIAGIYRNQFLSELSFQVLCFDGALLTDTYFSLERPVAYQAGCSKRIVLTSTDRLGLVNDFALSGRETENLYVPYLPMFVTSIFPTVFFYFSILALSISTFLFQLIISQLRVRKEVLLRVPITLPMALLGLIYAL